MAGRTRQQATTPAAQQPPTQAQRTAFLTKARRNHDNAYRNRRTVAREVTADVATLTTSIGGALDGIATETAGLANVALTDAEQRWVAYALARAQAANDGTLRETPEQATFFQTGAVTMQSAHPNQATAIGNLHDYSEDVERDARRRADAQARLRRAQDTYDTAIWYLNAAINNADEIILINDTLGDPLAPMPGQAPEVPAAPANDGQQPPDGASLPHYPFQDPDRDRCLKFRVSRGHIDELCQVLLGEDRCCQ